MAGSGSVAPSDKINLAYIGCGTQGLREMCELIVNPQIQIVTVCDPNKLTTDYIDWSPQGIKNQIRKVVNEPNWGEQYNGIMGGRDI
ncbi:MAG: gfo/Idh/MocA family oxidoreductase, partial [Bacteroidia bacterium]